MPMGIVGGISFILYGMIAAIGVRNVVEAGVDFQKSRNVIASAVIFVCALGINFSDAGAATFTVDGVTISLSGLAVAALVGIILNAIFPEKDEVKSIDLK